MFEYIYNKVRSGKLAGDDILEMISMSLDMNLIDWNEYCFLAYLSTLENPTPEDIGKEYHAYKYSNKFRKLYNNMVA